MPDVPVSPSPVIGSNKGTYMMCVVTCFPCEERHQNELEDVLVRPSKSSGGNYALQSVSGIPECYLRTRSRTAFRGRAVIDSENAMATYMSSQGSPRGLEMRRSRCGCEYTIFASLVAPMNE